MNNISNISNQELKLEALDYNIELILQGLEKHYKIPRGPIVDVATDLLAEMVKKVEKMSSSRDAKLNILAVVAMMMLASQISFQIKEIQKFAKKKGITEEQVRAEMTVDSFRHIEENDEKEEDS